MKKIPTWLFSLNSTYTPWKKYLPDCLIYDSTYTPWKNCLPDSSVYSSTYTPWKTLYSRDHNDWELPGSSSGPFNTPPYTVLFSLVDSVLNHDLLPTTSIIITDITGRKELLFYRQGLVPFINHITSPLFAILHYLLLNWSISTFLCWFPWKF